MREVRSLVQQLGYFHGEDFLDCLGNIQDQINLLPTIEERRGAAVYTYSEIKNRYGGFTKEMALRVIFQENLFRFENYITGYLESFVCKGTWNLLAGSGIQSPLILGWQKKNSGQYSQTLSDRYNHHVGSRTNNNLVPIVVRNQEYLEKFPLDVKNICGSLALGYALNEVYNKEVSISLINGPMEELDLNFGTEMERNIQDYSMLCQLICDSYVYFPSVWNLSFYHDNKFGELSIKPIKEVFSTNYYGSPKISSFINYVPVCCRIVYFQTPGQNEGSSLLFGSVDTCLQSEKIILNSKYMENPDGINRAHVVDLGTLHLGTEKVSLKELSSESTIHINCYTSSYKNGTIQDAGSVFDNVTTTGDCIDVDFGTELSHLVDQLKYRDAYRSHNNNHEIINIYSDLEVLEDLKNIRKSLHESNFSIINGKYYKGLISVYCEFEDQDPDLCASPHFKLI
jgi:hypothetical protein